MQIMALPEKRSDRPGSEWPVVERLRAVMGNADPTLRLHHEQTAADAIDRILELEAALRAIYDAADAATDETDWGNRVSAAMTDERRALITL